MCHWFKEQIYGPKNALNAQQNVDQNNLAGIMLKDTTPKTSLESQRYKPNYPANHSSRTLKRVTEQKRYRCAHEYAMFQCNINESTKHAPILLYVEVSGV
jgi:hypothetical protein